MVPSLAKRSKRLAGVSSMCLAANAAITAALPMASSTARAVADPAQPLRHRPETRLQQFYSCLTETQLSLFRGGA